jgi:hypothetical protein
LARIARNLPASPIAIRRHPRGCDARVREELARGEVTRPPRAAARFAYLSVYRRRSPYQAASRRSANMASFISPETVRAGILSQQNFREAGRGNARRTLRATCARTFLSELTATSSSFAHSSHRRQLPCSSAFAASSVGAGAGGVCSGRPGQQHNCSRCCPVDTVAEARPAHLEGHRGFCLWTLKKAPPRRGRGTLQCRDRQIPTPVFI